MPDYLSRQEVADLLGVHPNAVTNLVARRALPPPDGRIARAPYWKRSTIVRWLPNRRGRGRPVTNHTPREARRRQRRAGQVQQDVQLDGEAQGGEPATVGLPLDFPAYHPPTPLGGEDLSHTASPESDPPATSESGTTVVPSSITSPGSDDVRTARPS